ncbi:DNA polymerase I [Atopobium sp. oral taxon 199]|uniref:DNA polymerase I n=1 Tax=Atopobium sp. oral taxon 199 TaxID=712156 RepID=UPI00034E1B79|nr:DNA polymerase I [Atopobium sp. oral taxon 199]EPD77719.1 DNA polymerase I [Atopobium sp. oral taxon 199 str. F0494]
MSETAHTETATTDAARTDAHTDVAAGASRRTIAVIDGNSLMHRAFHAIRQPMSAPDGTPTGALFGFFNMFIKMVESFKPDGVICAFDKGKPQVRIDMLPQYKAQRPPMDDALHVQFPIVKNLLRTLDIPVCELEGWEGDDILGTLARRGEEAGYEMLLFTGDRDMYQLSTENVKIVSTRKGVSDVSIMTPESVADLYAGITPALVPDFYGLKGDSSDNIPGVPGIGPKKAAQLIVEYGSLDEVLAHADDVKGKMGENLRTHKEDALLSRKVATIRTDAPIAINLADAKFPTFDQNAVVAAFSKLGFTGMTRRLARMAGEKGGLSTAPEGEEASVPAALALPEILEADDANTALAASLARAEWLGVALDTGKQDGSLFGLEHTLWVATSSHLLKFEDDNATSALLRLFKEGKVAAGDVKELLHDVSPVDSSEPESFDPDTLAAERIFDTGVAAYLLESDRSDFAVPGLVERYFGVELPDGADKVTGKDAGKGTNKGTDKVPAAAFEANAVRALSKVLCTKLEADGSLELFKTIEMGLLPVLAAMERRGLYVDPAKLKEQSVDLGEDIASRVARIHEAAGENFNLDSPSQLSHVLFDVLGLPTFGLKKTRSGFYSTNAKVLADLADEYQIVADVLEYRERAKIKSTYLDALPALIRGDKRVHTTFNQTVAATGRLSSSDPNLQNIPTRSELGHRVRTAFTVPQDHVFLACDYSQIELRLLAHLSADEHLVAAFNSGADFHAATASRVFGVPVEDVTPELRSRAKAVNFGIVYGQQAYGLATSLKIPRSEAQDMIDRYFAAYPGVRAYLDESVRIAHKKGYAVTMYGRKRHIREFAQHNRQLIAFGERTAMNHPMQGSAADIIKIAMIRVEKRLREESLASKLILQIHDELDLEVPNAEIETVSRLVKETMEGVTTLKVPLIADVSYGPNWAEAK